MKQFKSQLSFAGILVAFFSYLISASSIALPLESISTKDNEGSQISLWGPVSIEPATWTQAQLACESFNYFDPNYEWTLPTKTDYLLAFNPDNKSTSKNEVVTNKLDWEEYDDFWTSTKISLAAATVFNPSNSQFTSGAINIYPDRRSFRCIGRSK